MDNSMLEKFAEIFMSARNSGVKVITDWQDGWRPKKPSNQDQVITEFITNLSEGQKKELLEVVRYSIDLSFYILLCHLETGEIGYTFDLKMMEEKTDRALQLISPDIDNGLIYESIDWVKKYGI